MELEGSWNFCSPISALLLALFGEGPLPSSLCSLPTTAPTPAAENAHLLFVQQLPPREPVWEYRGGGKGGKKLSQLEAAPRCCQTQLPSLVKIYLQWGT